MKCCLQHFFHMRWAYMRKNIPTDRSADRFTDTTASHHTTMTDHIRWPATHWRQQIHSLAQSQPVDLCRWLTIQLQLRIPHTVAKALYELCILYDCTFNCHVIGRFNDILSRSGDATFCRLLRHCSMPPNICIYTNVFAIRRSSRADIAKLNWLRSSNQTWGLRFANQTQMA